VARYVVDVMPKREILDPQGKAVLGALPRLGFGGVVDVRQGKRFEVEVEGDPDDDRLADVRRMAETLLANPVIEDFVVTVEPLPPGEETHPWVEPEGALPGEIGTEAQATDESPSEDTAAADTGGHAAPEVERGDA
jgi:phosphoribosylformylglycinamidine synthase PurS subunit